VQLGQIASFGIDPEVVPHKDDVDVVRLRFTKVDQVQNVALKTFLAERLR
jgi:hypothetical protein